LFRLIVTRGIAYVSASFYPYCITVAPAQKLITAATLVAAVLTAISQSNGNGQNLTPYRIKTP